MYPIHFAILKIYILGHIQLLICIVLVHQHIGHDYVATLFTYWFFFNWIFLQFRFLDGGLVGKEDDVKAITQGEGPRAASVELLNAEEASKFDVNGVSEWGSQWSSYHTIFNFQCRPHPIVKWEVKCAHIILPMFS